MKMNMLMHYMEKNGQIPFFAVILFHFFRILDYQGNMEKMKNIRLSQSLLLILLLITLFVPSGCRKVESEDVISKVINAYSEVKTYSVTEKTLVKKEVIGGDRPGTKFYGQNCTGSINIMDRQCEMDIMQDGFPMQDMQTYIKQYLINEMRYTKADILDYEDKSHEVWVKVSLRDEEMNQDDRLWENSNILGQQIESLSTAKEVILVKTEKYNGVNTYVLDIKPDWEVFTGLITGGPPWHSPSRLNFPELNGYLSFRMWVSKETSLIVKSEINTIYKVISADSSNVTENFISEIYFNDYNRPFEVELPEEALKAIRGPIS